MSSFNISENMPYMVLTASLFFFLVTIFPEHVPLCFGIVATCFFLYYVVQNLIAEIGRIRAEINSRDANYVTEAQNIISTINNLTGEYNEIKRVLETYHNNFNQIATEFETIGRSIVSLQSENNQRYALTQSTNRRGSDQPSEALSSSAHSQSSTHSSPNSS
ncbi:16971_t:CDS:1, partial [Dentiscutata erythropus]